MSQSRSPRYPSVGLSEAIERAGELYNREKKTHVSFELVAKAWGYKHSSSAVRTKIGALRQYGLLEGVKDVLRVSDLAIAILVHPEKSKEREDALAEAALSPVLFQDIRTNKPDASDEALAAYLVTKKSFNEDAAKLCVTAFRDTMAIAGKGITRYDEKEARARDLGGLANIFALPTRRPSPSLQKEEPGKPEMKHDTYTLDEGDVVLQWPSKLSQESYAELEDWLVLMGRKMKRAVTDQIKGEQETE